VITGKITILGSGATIQRNGATPFRLFTVETSGDLELRDVTLRSGVAQGGIGGSGGTNNGGGSWTLTPAQLAGLTLTAGDDDVATITLSVTANATEGGTTAHSATQTITITENPVPEAPVLTAANAWAAHTGLSGWVRWPLFLLALAGLIGMTVAEFTDGADILLFGCRFESRNLGFNVLQYYNMFYRDGKIDGIRARMKAEMAG
jgi:hypothetical protein